jgi:1-acyl-sn-glycerol-3-phosphate acyltransferase
MSAIISTPADREPFVSLLFYHLFKWSIVSPMLHTYFRGRIYDADRVPQKGALIIVANHASDFDPPLLSSCVHRPVSYMAKEELFQVPVFSQAIQVYGAYPVKRGSPDRSAIRAALAQLEAGWAVGLFLQGTRTADERISAAKLGAAMIGDFGNCAEGQRIAAIGSRYGTSRGINCAADFQQAGGNGGGDPKMCGGDPCTP